MLKRYKSKSCVSLNVVLPTGGNTHVSFSPVTGSGSVFYTDNVNIQQGLERHPKFGKLFVLDNSLNVQTPSASKTKSAKEAATKDAKRGTKKIVEVKMACNDDAKDYLADKYGISRSKMRSRSDIEKSAEANGVKIIWS